MGFLAGVAYGRAESCEEITALQAPITTLEERNTKLARLLKTLRLVRMQQDEEAIKK